MPQENPPLLDKTMNTTEQTPRNLADVLASGLANIANNVKPDGSDISIDVPGMSANNVNDGFIELKGTLEFKAGDTYTINFVGGYTVVPARLGWDRTRCIATFPMPKLIPDSLNVNATSIPTSGIIYLNDGTSYSFTNAIIYSVWKHRNMLTLIFTFTPSTSLSGIDIGANVEFTTGDLTLSFS